MYTPVSGIWQTVWLEAVSDEAYLGEVKITTDIDKGTVKIIPFGHEALRSRYKVKASVYKNKSIRVSILNTLFIKLIGYSKSLKEFSLKHKWFRTIIYARRVRI